MIARPDSISQVPVEATYALRQSLLRQGRPLSSCQFPNDHHPRVAHFLALRNQCQAGIVSVFPVPLRQESQAWQIRAMATVPWLRRQGYGLALLNAAECYVSHHAGTTTWCHARVGAVGFYERAGYRISGEQFLIHGVGAHYLMFKHLDSYS